MNRPSISRETAASAADLRLRVEALDQTIQRLTAAVEGTAPPITRAALDDVNARLEEVEQRLASAKGRAKEQKRVMGGWWAWFGQLPDDARAAQAARLTHESHHRGRAIAKLEADIVALEEQRSELMRERQLVAAEVAVREGRLVPDIEALRQELADARDELSRFAP